MNRLRLFLVALSTALAFVALGLAPATTSTAATVVINPFRFGGTPTSADTDVQAWINRIYADGGTVSQAAVNSVTTFVGEAKADGYWTTFRRLNLFVGDSVAYLHPLVNTSGSAKDATVGAGMTYAESTGPVTDGASCLDTDYTPTEETGGLSVYLRTTQASDTTIRVPVGTSNGSEYFRLAANVNASSGTAAGGFNGRWGDGLISGGRAGTSTTGMVAAHWHISRTSTTALQLHKNGATQDALQATAATPTTPSQSVYVFCDNGSGSALRFLAASSSIGSYDVNTGMSDAQDALYYTDLQAFQTAMGRAI